MAVSCTKYKLHFARFNTSGSGRILGRGEIVMCEFSLFYIHCKRIKKRVRIPKKPKMNFFEIDSSPMNMTTHIEYDEVEMDELKVRTSFDMWNKFDKLFIDPKNENEGDLFMFLMKQEDYLIVKKK